MAFAFKLCVAILSCVLYVQADVSHLGYSRYTGQRVQPLRLQRLESSPTPYPAAGYRPNREFNLPREQPLFPVNTHQNSRPHHSSGFDSLSEPQRPQRPQLVYGSPEPRFPQQPRFPQRPQQSGPQNSNGFNSFAQPQQPEFVEQTQFSQGNQQPQNNQNDFNNFAEPQQPQNNDNDFNTGFNQLAEPQQPQQRPELLYGAPNVQEQQAQSGSDILSEPQQRPQYNYNVPSAQLRQLLVAKLQQAARLQQQFENQGYRQSQSPSSSQRQQQFSNSPQTLYAAPGQQQQQQQTQVQSSQAQAESQIAPKPARLTDNREDREEESDAKTSETVVDIETTTKSDDQKTANQMAVTPAAVAATGLYYPAAAFSYVQPFSAAYVAAANYQTVQPAYTVGSPFLPQQYALAAAAPAQLQAW